MVDSTAIHRSVLLYSVLSERFVFAASCLEISVWADSPCSLLVPYAPCILLLYAAVKLTARVLGTLLWLPAPPFSSFVGQKKNQDAESEHAAMIDVPAHDAVRFVMELLMMQQEESGARAAAATVAAVATGETSLPAKKEGEEDEAEKEDDRDSTPEEVCLGTD